MKEQPEQEFHFLLVEQAQEMEQEQKQEVRLFLDELQGECQLCQRTRLLDLLLPRQYVSLDHADHRVEVTRGADVHLAEAVRVENRPDRVAVHGAALVRL